MHHFPSKQHLLVALADYRLKQGSLWKTESGRLNDEDDFGFWRGIVEVNRRLINKPGFIELFVIVAFEAADPTSPVHSLYQQRYDEVIGIVAQHYQDGIDRGIFRPDIDCTLLGSESIAVSDGLQLQWALSDGKRDLVHGIREFHERQLSAIVLPGITVDLSPLPKTRATAKA